MRILQHLMMFFIMYNKSIEVTKRMNSQKCRKIVSNYSYLSHEKLGSGCSSQVFQGTNDKTGERVAIKVIPRTPEQIHMAECQIRALTLLQGAPNIIQLNHALQTKNSVYIITELCEGGTLHQVITRHHHLPQSKAITFLRCIINGFIAMASHGLVHRDIKPDNMFLSGKEELKIGDFGFSVESQICNIPSSDNLGSPLYMPYQSLASNIYNHQSDIWAIGVTFIEMLTGKTPWKAKTQKELMLQLCSFKVDDILPKKASEKSKDFLRRVLVFEPEKRMNLGDLSAFEKSLSESQNIENIQSAAKLNNTLSQNIASEKNLVFLRSNNRSKSQLLTNDYKSSKPAAQSAIVGGSSRKGNKQLLQLNKKKSTIKVDEESTEQHSKGEIKTPNIQNQPNLNMRKKSFSITEAQKSGQNPLLQSIKLYDERQINKKIQQEKNQSKIISKIEKIKAAPKLSEKRATISTNSSTTKEFQKLNSKIEREILILVQSQINYFRFTFKLFKKMNEILKTSDQHIKSFKENLIYVTHAKIEQIKSMNYLMISPRVLDTFKNTAQFTNMQQVLEQYRQRYQKDQEKAGLTANFTSDKAFMSLLSYLINVLYQNIAKNENNMTEFSRKKSLIFILEDLVTLSRLYVLDQQHDWQNFHKEADIAEILEKSNQEDDVSSYWKSLKTSIIQIITQ